MTALLFNAVLFTAIAGANRLWGGSDIGFWACLIIANLYTAMSLTVGAFKDWVRIAAREATEL